MIIFPTFSIYFYLSYPLVNLPMLKLHKPGGDRGDVTLLVGERHSARSLRVAELRVRIDAGVANPAIKPVHNHGEFH